MSKKILNNNNKGLYVLIAILLVAIVALLSVIVFNNTSKKNDNASDTVLKNDDKIELTDEIKYDLSSKINTLISPLKSTTYNEREYYSPYLFKFGTLYRELTAIEKQTLVLEHLSFSFLPIYYGKWEEVDYVKKAVDSYANAIGNNMLAKEAFGVLSYNEVNKVYKDFFGEDLENPEELVGGCPPYYYSSKTKEFYKMLSNCGGTAIGEVLSYKEKFETTQDTVAVYVDFGFVRPKEGEQKFIVYGDFEIPSETGSLTQIGGYKNVIEELPYANIDNLNYEITDNNKDKFSQYKFIFKKNGDNFYFEKVTKVR